MPRGGIQQRIQRTQHIAELLVVQDGHRSLRRQCPVQLDPALAAGVMRRIGDFDGLRHPINAGRQDEQARSAISEPLADRLRGPQVQMIEDQRHAQIMDVINAGHLDKVRQADGPRRGPFRLFQQRHAPRA